MDMVMKREGDFMSVKVGRLYNASRKEEYIESKPSDNYKDILYWLFDSTFELENKKSKDVHNFDLEDFKDVFYSRKVNENTSKIMLAQFREYIDWARGKGYCYKSVNPLESKYITQEFIKDISKATDRLFTINEIEEIIEIDEFTNDKHIENTNYLPLRNYQDRAMIALIFFGVSGRNLFDIINAKITDINFDKNTITVDNEDNYKEIVLTRPTIELLEKANKESFYDSNLLQYSQKTKDWRYLYTNTPYILKRTYYENKHDENEEQSPIPDFVLRSRMRSVSKYLGETITANNLFKSGMVFMAYRAYKAYGEISHKSLEKVFERFDLTNTSQSFKSQKIKWLKEKVNEMYLDQ